MMDDDTASAEQSLLRSNVIDEGRDEDYGAVGTAQRRRESTVFSKGRSYLFIYYLGVLASIGGMLFGYDTGVISGAIIQLRSDPDKWKQVGGMNLDSFEQEMVVGIATAGAILGSVFSSYLNNWYGRRKTIMGSSLFFVGGAVIMGLAHSVEVLLTGRFVVGISVGLASHTVPLYLAEVSPEDLRGLIVTMNNVSIVCGQVLASLVDCGFAVGRVPEGWRYMLALGGVPGIMLLLGFAYLPESPRWLVAHKRAEEAEISLSLIRNASRDEVRPELRKIATHVSETQSNVSAITLADLWLHRKQLTIGCGLQLLQQLAGINTLMYYSSTILSASSDTDEKSDPWSSGNNEAICLSSVTAFAQLVGVGIGMLFVDRYGRRLLTLSSLAVVTASLVLLGFAFYNQKSQGMALTGMIIYLVAFGIGMSPMPWLINAEIYPMYIRGTAISISTGVNWIANLIVSTTFLSLAEYASTSATDRKNHPDGAFWIFSCISFLGFLWIFFTLPETKGKTLEEISNIFRAKSPRSGALSSLENQVRGSED